MGENQSKHSEAVSHLLDVIYMLHQAWNHIKPRAVEHCFKILLLHLGKKGWIFPYLLNGACCVNEEDVTRVFLLVWVCFVCLAVFNMTVLNVGATKMDA